MTPTLDCNIQARGRRDQEAEWRLSGSRGREGRGAGAIYRVWAAAPGKNVRKEKMGVLTGVIQRGSLVEERTTG